MDGPPKPRKRDRFLRFLGQDSRPSSAQKPEATPRTAAQSPRAQSSPQSVRFSEAAIQTLTSDERALFERHTAQHARDDAEAIAAVYEAAVRQKEICEEKRWRVHRSGKDLVLREEADKVIRLIERFKGVGDVVANVDPIHIGLPWAGVRMIIEIVTAESQLMARVLSGIRLGMYTVNRLRAYLGYLARLPDMETKKTFERTLVKMYVAILQFFDDAVRIYETGTLRRAWGALWTESETERFEKRCKTWSMHIGFDIDNCDRELLWRNESDARKWKARLDDSIRTLDGVLHSIQGSLALLHRKHDIANLTFAHQAMYDSFEGQHLVRCLPGTCTGIVRQILDWASDEDGKRIFWLCGMAGTGKSTISRTVAHTLDRQHCLGASFFFKRGEGDRGNASRFFPTIVRQLVDSIPGFDIPVAEALKRDSLLCSRGLEQQFESLLHQPLSKLEQGSAMIIVVDAMDECENDQDIRAILALLARLDTGTSTTLRLFVTSRPELPVKLQFRAISGGLHQDVVLEEVQGLTIRDDIRAYFEHRFAALKTEDSLSKPYVKLPQDWPGERNIEILVDMSTPLFIAAFTICEYVSEMEHSERLDTIVDRRRQRHVLSSGLEQTYLIVLGRLVTQADDHTRRRAIETFKVLVGSIIVLVEPLSVESLNRLLNIPLSTIGYCLQNLHSVLHVPSDSTAPVRPFHLSFREFLTDPHRATQNPFHIDEAQAHGRLALQCIRLLNGNLKRNLCDLGNPGYRRKDFGGAGLASVSNLAYACLYWPFHLVNSTEEIGEYGIAHDFLRVHFLHWLEALAWLDKLTQAVEGIQMLQALVQPGEGDQFLPFLAAARRFILDHRSLLDLAPLQVYCSALIFMPEGNMIRRMFGSDLMVSGFELITKVLPVEDAELQRMNLKRSRIYDMALTPDERFLAVAVLDLVIEIWDTATGEKSQTIDIGEIMREERPTVDELASYDVQSLTLWVSRRSVNDLLFTSDGQSIVFAIDHTIWVFDIVTHRHNERKFEGHESHVLVMKSSPVSGMRVIASASSDGTILLWDATTTQQIHKFAMAPGIPTISYSPDGQLLVSAATGGSVSVIRYWDTRTGEQLRQIEALDGDILTLMFRQDSPGLLCVHVNGVARILDPTTGQVMRTTEGRSLDSLQHDVQFCGLRRSHHERIAAWTIITGKDINMIKRYGTISAMTPSENMQTLAVVTGQTVRMWSTDHLSSPEDSEWQSIETGVLGVRFSPSRQIAALICTGANLELWSAKTGKMVHRIRVRAMQGSRCHILDVAFSHESVNIAVAASDLTIRLYRQDTEGWKETHKLQHGEEFGHLHTLKFSADDSVLLVRSQLRESTRWRLYSMLEKDKQVISCSGPIALNQDSKIMASRSSRGTICVQCIATGAERNIETVGRISALAFSLDSQTLALADKEGIVMLQELRDKIELHGSLRYITDQAGNTKLLAFSPDGRRLALYDRGKELRIIDIETGGMLHCVKTRSYIYRLAFSKGGEFLQTNSGNFETRPAARDGSYKSTEDIARFQVVRSWIKRGEQDVVWLPDEYSDHVIDVQDNTIVLAQLSGHITIINLDTRWNRA